MPVIEASELSDLFDGLKSLYQPLIGHPYRLAKDGITGIGDDLVDRLREDWEVFSDLIDDGTAEGILVAVWPRYVGEYLSRGNDRWRDVRADWDDLKRSLMHERRFIREGNPAGAGILDMLDPWVDALGSTLTITSWRRARVQESRDGAFPCEQMGAPPPERAQGGRANPAGISHLYVASDESTAVAEVRAEPGDWVTIATVTMSVRAATVLDLTRDVRIIDPFAHADLDEALMTRELLQLFAGELSKPVRAGDRDADYVATQFLSEYFRDRAFDGILYPSALAQGQNGVFFNPAIANITSCTTRAVVSKTLTIVDGAEYDRRERARQGLPA